jgi:hypothetical protein
MQGADWLIVEIYCLVEKGAPARHAAGKTKSRRTFKDKPRNENKERKMDSEAYNLSGFTRVNIRFAMEVEIVRSDSFSVNVSGSDTFLDNVDVYLEGDKLVLGYDLNLMSFLTAPFTHARARITMPELKELNIAGAARGTVRGFASQNDFDLYVSGASRLEISDMSVGNMKWDLSGASRINGQIKTSGDIDFNITGASRIDLKGSARDIRVHATGASHIDLDDFPVRNANVRMTGASRSMVKPSGKLDVVLEGASNLEYDGQVTMGEVRISGASTFKKK